MRALVCKAYGSPDDLRVEDWDDPVPGDHDVVLDVAAAGINFPDVLSIAGQYQVKAPLPFIPGNEAAGVVSAIGNKVRHLALGERVIALPRGGAFAEKCIVDASAVAPIPGAMSLEDAAGFGVIFGTSFHALTQCAHLRHNETLLVLGAAGGVGSAAVEIGKALGGRVIAAASSDDKLDFARAAGADELINYSSESIRDRVKALTDGSGVDVVYDAVGGEHAQQALRGLAWHGRYLVVGFASGDIPQFPANIVLLKEASINGVWWGTWMAKHPREHQQNMQTLVDMLVAGSLSSKVTARFALSDFRPAFRAITERRAVGKVIIQMGEGAE